LLVFLEIFGAGEGIRTLDANLGKDGPIHAIPQARYRPCPVASRNPSSGPGSAPPAACFKAFGDHAGAGDRMGECEIDETGKVCRRAPSGQFALQQLARHEQPIVLLEAGLGGGGDRRAPGDQASRPVSYAMALARHGSQAEVETDKMGLCLASLPQKPADQPGAEPGSVLQRLDRLPGFEQQGGREQRRHGFSLVDNAPPGQQSRIFTPVAIVIQGIARRQIVLALDHPLASRHCLVDRGKGAIELAFVFVVSTANALAVIGLPLFLVRPIVEIDLGRLPDVALPAQDREANFGQRPVGRLGGDPAAGAEICVGASCTCSAV
jgi:hypothetical protein